MPLSRLSTADIAGEVRRAGIAPFDRLVAQILSQSPYREARRAFRVLDKVPPSAARRPLSTSRRLYPPSPWYLGRSTPDGCTRAKSTSHASPQDIVTTRLRLSDCHRGPVRGVRAVIRIHRRAVVAARRPSCSGSRLWRARRHWRCRASPRRRPRRARPGPRSPTMRFEPGRAVARETQLSRLVRRRELAE